MSKHSYPTKNPTPGRAAVAISTIFQGQSDSLPELCGKSTALGVLSHLAPARSRVLLIVTTQEKRQIKLLDVFFLSANVLVHTGVVSKKHSSCSSGIVSKKRSYCISGVDSPAAGWYPTGQRHWHDSYAFDRHHSRKAPN